MVIVDGMFDPVHLGPAIEAYGVEAALGADGTLRGEFEGGSFEVTATRAEVRVGDFEPIGEGIAGTLGGARPTATSAWWFWIHDPGAMAPDLPFLADAASPAILDLSFVDGTQLAARLDFDSEGAARVARDALRDLPAMVLGSMPGRQLRDLYLEWLRPLDVKAEGTRVTLRLALPTVQEMVHAQARAALR